MTLEDATALDLLLADDDAARAQALASALRAAGHRITVCASGHDALDLIDRDHFDALVIERELPRFDGVAACERLRQRGVTLPIILLSTLGDAGHRVRGLEAGADDYVVRPAETREILARITAVVRGRRWAAMPGDTLRVGDILISPLRHRAWRGGRVLDLSRTELGLLAELARNVDAVLTRPMLAERVWGQEEAPSNVIDVFIRRLRQKLADERPAPIVTIRGVGYMMRSPPADAPPAHARH